MLRKSLLPGALCASLAGGALAQAPNCEGRQNNTFDKLLACVTPEGVRTHLAALQQIADANGGTRISGAPGYAASVDYIVAQLGAAGFTNVAVQDFTFQAFISLTPSLLERVAPAPAGPIDNSMLAYSGSADVTAAVTALPAPPVDSTPGCEAADFAGFPAGNIALISRGGGCSFALKATNAYNAGASGVVIYNNVAGTLNGTLGYTFTADIGVTSVTQAAGLQLANTPGLQLRLKTDTFRGLATSHNVLAETASGDPNNVIMVGAHLDSVNAGPGINDNGSASAVLLETARQVASVQTRNKLRFAWWGAHEAGLAGVVNYLNGLSSTQLAKIALYVDAHALGSPNYVHFVLDGDNSEAEGDGAGPAGSAQVESTIARYFDSAGLPWKSADLDLNGNADYAPFAANGVPVGGITTGTAGIKDAAEAATWGGTAGVAYDPCFHAACDTYANINDTALGVSADAIAFVTLQYAMDASDVTGVRGKGNFRKKKLVPLKDTLARK